MAAGVLWMKKFNATEIAESTYYVHVSIWFYLWTSSMWHKTKTKTYITE